MEASSRRVPAITVCLMLALCMASCGSQPIKPSPQMMSFGVYGNWCGPDHPRDMSTAGLPMNALDAGCMHHDMCYVTKGKYACECDKIFSDELAENLLADKYPAEQKYYARSFYQYFKGSWCIGIPESKIGVSRALQSIYNNTSQKAVSIYDSIFGNAVEISEDETAPVTTSQNNVKKK